MTTVALITEPLILLAVMWFMLRLQRERSGELVRVAIDSNARAHEYAQRLAELVEHERDARRDEIQMLLQRIQAPQQAVIDHAVRQTIPDPDGRPRTEEESARASDERVALQQVVEEVERIEREAQEALGMAQVAGV